MSPLAITFICIAGILLLLFVAYFSIKHNERKTAKLAERRDEERRYRE